jgi:trehalose-6-phosphate synthase
MSGRVRRPRGITRVLFGARRARALRPREPRGEAAARLRAFAAEELPNGVTVAADVEPYAHEWQHGGEVTVKRAASDVVRAVEPMLHACGGTWIGHAGGSADRAYTSRTGRIAVPRSAADYTLRRLFIDERTYAQHAAFANEGLFPLCHTAFIRPAFRASDWSAYQDVTEIFAQAAIGETPRGGVLLIQDYQLALVPKLVRDEEPNLVTSLFWHVPWPNADTAALCPWRDVLVQGMVGADVLGFQTRQSALNFLETVRRSLECRVDLDAMSVSYRGRRTVVRVYPVSTEWPYRPASRDEGARLRRELGIDADAHVVLTIDDTNASLDKCVFVRLPDCDDEQRARYFAMADTMLVTPPHDGMSLAAKEYVAACGDGDGALVLSLFDDAARELDHALLVHPYDTGEIARAIVRAVRMPLVERRTRMEAMRRYLAAHSAYDWSQKVLRDLCDIRVQRSSYCPAAINNSSSEVLM